MLLCTLALAEVQQPKLLAHSFDREMLVKSIGLFQFHIYDTISQTVNISAKAFADEDSITAIKNYTEADYSKPDQSKFGLAKGRNVIFVTLESTQSFVLNEKVNGKEITPFMNDLIKKAIPLIISISKQNKAKHQIQNLSSLTHCIPPLAAPSFSRKATINFIRCINR